MPRIFEHSSPSESPGVVRNSCRYKKWTNPGSSYCDNSWRVWNRSCNPITFESRKHVLCRDILRNWAICERGSYSQHEHHVQQKIARTSSRTRRKGSHSLQGNLGRYKHAGNTCRFYPPYSKQGIHLHKKNHSEVWQKLDRYSCNFEIWRSLGSVNLQDSYKDMSPLGPRRTRVWWVETLALNETCIGKKISTWRSTKFQWWSVVTKVFWSQYNKKNRILQSQRWILMSLTSDSGTLWWHSNRAKIDGICIYSSWLEENFHRGHSWNYQSILWHGLIPRRKGERQRPSGSPCNTNESLWTRLGRADRTPRFHSSKESTLRNSLERYQKCRTLSTIIKSAGSRIGILADEVLCNHDLRCDTRRLQWQNRVLFERLETLRLAPKVTLKMNWHGKRRQQHSTSRTRY